MVHQLLKKSKRNPDRPTKRRKGFKSHMSMLFRVSRTYTTLQPTELHDAIHIIKNNKVVGLDDFGPGVRDSLLNMINNCLSSTDIPKLYGDKPESLH